MKRWNKQKGEFEHRPEIDAFLQEIEEVCKRHGLSISHQDGHGSFVIERYCEYNVGWLEEASVNIDEEEKK